MGAKAEKNDQIEEQNPTRGDKIALSTAKLQKELFRLYEELKELDGKGLTMTEVETMFTCLK